MEMMTRELSPIAVVLKSTFQSNSITITGEFVRKINPKALLGLPELWELASNHFNQCSRGYRGATGLRVGSHLA